MKNIYKLTAFISLAMITVLLAFGHSFDAAIFWASLVAGSALIIMPLDSK